VFSGISLKQLIAELYRDISAKLYMNTNSGTLPQKAIAGYSGSYSGRFKTISEMSHFSSMVLSSIDVQGARVKHTFQSNYLKYVNKLPYSFVIKICVTNCSINRGKKILALV
jgi:hypothetical protein